MSISEKPNLSILNLSLASGGAEKVISLLLKELVNDYNVTLVLFYNNIHFPIPENVKTVIFSDKHPNRPYIKRIFDFISFIFKYNRLLKQRKIAYAVSFLAFPNIINGIASIFNKKTKTFISERGFPSNNTTSKISLYISKVFYPVFYNKCYKLFSNSIYINKDLKENFGVTIPMDVIYNPIEIPTITKQPKLLNSPKNTLKIVTAGTVNIRKNQEMIIRAIKNTPKDFQLTILGDGHLIQKLTELIANEKLENAVFLKGMVKNVNEHLVTNDCFVLSSYTEGFPNALLEAMAIGLPSISTNCMSGPLELLHDNGDITIDDGDFFKAKYGILVNNNDDIGLAKALEYLKLHPEECKRYSQLSLDRSQEYHLKNIYTRFNQFINS